MLRSILRRSRPRSLEQHRDYVGGLWDEIGRLQFDFMVGQGLRPQHVLLDIACGSLRGGVHFIAYLEAGNYLGLDHQRRLIELGIEKELGGPEVAAAKQPEFVISDNFEFDKFSKRPDFSLAQSLFTHLTEERIATCLRNLRAFVSDGHPFFATFFEGASHVNPPESHDLDEFFYPPDALAELGSRTGWNAEQVAGFAHPRDQRMMKFVAV